MFFFFFVFVGVKALRNVLHKYGVGGGYFTNRFLKCIFLGAEQSCLFKNWKLFTARFRWRGVKFNTAYRSNERNHDKFGFYCFKYLWLKLGTQNMAGDVKGHEKILDFFFLILMFFFLKKFCFFFLKKKIDFFLFFEKGVIF